VSPRRRSGLAAVVGMVGWLVMVVLLLLALVFIAGYDGGGLS